jgi:hypothetical protein
MHSRDKTKNIYFAREKLKEMFYRELKQNTSTLQGVKTY